MSAEHLECPTCKGEGHVECECPHCGSWHNAECEDCEGAGVLEAAPEELDPSQAELPLEPAP